MHVLTITEPVFTAQGNFPAGRWLVEDQNAAELMMIAGGGACRLEHWTPPVHIKDAAGPEHIIVIRPGRFGDLILLTPALRALKRQFQAATLHVATYPNYRDALIGCPYIDNFISYPIDADALPKGQVAFAPLEIERGLSELEQQMHMSDIFARRIGVGEDMTDAEKKPDFFLTMEERDWAFEKYPRLKSGKEERKRVVIQISSSTKSRDYPPKLMGDVLRKLVGRNWDVVLLGLPNQITGENPGITNCAKDALTFRQSAAVIATADVFLGPDSSFIHVAGAMGVPAVGLFAVIPWQLRTKYCPTTFVIQAKKGCDIAPCFFVPHTTRGWPAEGPCIKTRKCEALDTIEPHEVVVTIEERARN